MKREFLVDDIKAINSYLRENSLASKLYRYRDKNSYMYEFDGYCYVLEVYDGFEKLILVSERDTALARCVEQLEEITDDQRYTKEYLELFGNPKKYEFDENKLFKKCDSSAVSGLDLRFKDGMSSAKVFRVILYRLNQIFTLKYGGYIKKEIEYEELEQSYKRFLKALKYSKEFFNHKIIKQIKNDFEELDVLLSDKESFERFELDFQMFAHEESFYNTQNSNKAIGFFRSKKKLFGLLKES